MESDTFNRDFKVKLIAGGNSLTFGTGVRMSSNFLRPQLIRPSVLKDPN